MITRDDVEVFLEQFKVKMEIYGILFRLRTDEKNTDTLAILNITERYRKDVIKDLVIDDYSEGPVTDELYHGTDMWVFGKNVKGQEVYIKITMGKPNSRTICISFHIAKRPMSYPLKKNTNAPTA